MIIYKVSGDDRMRILIIEDDKKQCFLLQFRLEKEGFSADICNDGADADLYLSQNAYDMVLLDRMLPHKDGVTILREMRERGDHTPVIMLTAKSEVDDKVMGLDAGANDYLTKPFATKELLARLRALTRSPQVAADNSLHVGNLTLDRGTFELYTPSGKYRLAGKEFQMIEMLMATPGMLISTEKFMDKIWGIDSEADISVVWTYISFLRKKLVSLEANVQINAKRNAGYTLEAKGD